MVCTVLVAFNCRMLLIEGGDILEIQEEVVYALLQEIRRDELVAVDDGQEEIFVEAVVEPVHGTVKTFPRVRDFVREISKITIENTVSRGSWAR